MYTGPAADDSANILLHVWGQDWLDEGVSSFTNLQLGVFLRMTYKKPENEKSDIYFIFSFRK